MNIMKHIVFVLNKEGNPLSPTTPTKARKLLQGGVAKKVWSKFNTFGIQLLVEVGSETPKTTLGADFGTKFEGYSVLVGDENVLNIKLDLPAKQKLVKKLEERRLLRRARRYRLRRRKARFNNRVRKPNWIAPSQLQVVNSRLKILKELVKIFPVRVAAIEDVCFNHQKRWGKNFSTVEIGKSLIRKFFEDNLINLCEYKGYETSELRKGYGYKKISDKSKNCFESHCCDSLTLATEVNQQVRVQPSSSLIVVDDAYRCVRRKLFDTQFKTGHVKEKYSRGTVFGVSKGKIIGTKRRIGLLCGEWGDRFAYYDSQNKRQSTKKLEWISTQFRARFNDLRNTL